MKSARPRGVDSAKVVQVIETVSSRGNGTYGDPCRCVIQYWSFDGCLLAEKDPKEESANVKSPEINIKKITEDENIFQNLNKKNPYAVYGI